MKVYSTDICVSNFKACGKWFLGLKNMLKKMGLKHPRVVMVVKGNFTLIICMNLKNEKKQKLLENICDKFFQKAL
jgi:hypothetical protein